MSDESIVVGMIPSRNSVVLPWPGRRRLLSGRRGVLVQPEACARLDQVADEQTDAEGDGRHGEEVAEGEAADLAHLRAALATEPTPSTIVQKMIGEIIILMRATKPVPSGLSSVAKPGATTPTRMPSATATITAT